MSENKADNRSGINQLPEECHREVHSGCLDPYSNELISGILKKNGSSKAHKRTHKSNRWNGDRKYHTERMAGSEINHAGSTCKSKFGYDDERPFFHFKTNRIELSKELKKRKYDC